MAADKLAGAAARWFRRIRQIDDLSRLVKAATGTSASLSHAEIKDLRGLLEDEETWRQLAGLDVARLTGRVADCLSLRGNRTTADARAIAEAIARGLLEFAVFDLQPEVFRKVALVRFQQMTVHASALDEVLLRMHKDLYAFVDDAKDLFRQAMNRLPPGPADLNEIKIYLKTLVHWLNTDPWPQDPRLGGPVLTPATLERKLQVSSVSPTGQQNIDADELSRRCSRLVILGSSGSGKTWLAMRTARICAEKALKGLEDEATLDEVELPLYTTCSRLISTSGDFREAAVSSALNWMGDLGGSRIIKALCHFFTERDKLTVLIIDSLDEAGDGSLARDRLRQADSLDRAWRVVLTSRPSSWNNQLNMGEANQNHWIGELQPLRYPQDVEAVIRRWFAGNPERGQDLAAQLAGRPSLRRAATVPLILAFFCILGGERPLPKFRHELYRQVINRMLHAPWRPGGDPPQDTGDCRAALQKWAWQGADTDPVSGIGRWKDDIHTQHIQLSPAEQAAVDHIAAPRGAPNFDTGDTSRRFVHRSIQEHLVAEHIALRRGADEAVSELLNHLWYDTDWEYAAPAALVMHAQRDQVLKELICRVTGSDQLPADLSAIDGCWEMRRFLARVAQESGEADWSPELAEMIGRARLDVARANKDDPDQVATSEWPTSTALITRALLRKLACGADPWTAMWLAWVVDRMDPAAEERAQARQALLGVLARTTNDWTARQLAQVLDRMDLAAEERAQARQALLGVLARTTNDWTARELAQALDRMDPAAEERAQARQALLGLLARTTDHWTARELA